MSQSTPEQIRVFIIYGYGAEPLLDYTAHRIWRASQNYRVEYSAYSWHPSEKISDTDRRTSIEEKVKEARCVIVIWTPEIFEEYGEIIRDVKVERELEIALEIARDRNKEIKEAKQLGKKAADPLEFIVTRWYRNPGDPLPLTFMPRKTIDVPFNNSLSHVISELNEICEPHKSRKNEEAKTSENYFPLDQSTASFVLCALRALITAFKTEEPSSKEPSSKEPSSKEPSSYPMRAALYWQTETDNKEWYMVMAAGAYTSGEIRAPFGKQDNRLKKISEEEESWFFKIDPNVESSSRKSVSVVHLIKLGSTTLKALIVVENITNDNNWDPDSEREPQNSKKIPQNSKKIIEDLKLVIQKLFPERPLSYRHYMNINALLRAVRLFPDLDQSITATLYHVNNKVDSNKFQNQTRNSDTALDVKRIHPSIVSPSIEDVIGEEDIEGTIMKRIADANRLGFAKDEGFIGGEIWRHGVYLAEDRSDLGPNDKPVLRIENLQLKYAMTKEQAETFFVLNSLVAFPVRGNIKDDKGVVHREVIGVLGIFGTQPLWESKLDTYTFYYWFVVNTIERILNSKPI
jgi:hypothetical protein